MNSFLKRILPLLFVALVFAIIRVTVASSLGAIDYITTYLVFVYFYMPVLLEKSIWEMIDLPRPRFIRAWILTRRRKYLEKGRLNFRRINAVLTVIVILYVILQLPIIEILVDANSARRQELADSSVVDRLMLQSGILISVVVAMTMLASNLLRKGFIDWNVNKRIELLKDYPRSIQAFNIGFLIVLPPMLLLSSRLGKFISGNFSYPVLLAVQAFIALMLWPGDRLLRNRQ